MISMMRKVRNRVPGLRDQGGITGLETAIVLIAFVVVASVFAFAVLSTGLLSSEKSKETVLGGLEETQSTIALRGSVIGHRTSTFGLENVHYVTFQVSNATQGAVGVDLSSSTVIVTYLDDSQVLSNIAFNAVPTTTDNTWGTSFLSGSGPLLEADERVEFTVNLDGLTTNLAVSTQFRIEVKPQVGATLVVERTTPAELKDIVNLQ